MPFLRIPSCAVRVNDVMWKSWLVSQGIEEACWFLLSERCLNASGAVFVTSCDLLLLMMELVFGSVFVTLAKR